MSEHRITMRQRERRLTATWSHPGHSPDDHAGSALHDAYTNLPPEDQELYRVLGLMPGNNVGVDAIAAYLNIDEGEAERRLRRLCEARLLQRTDRRFLLHDAVAQHAAATALVTEPAAVLLDRMRTIAEWFLHTAVAAALAEKNVFLWYDDDAFHRPATTAFTRRSGLDWLEREQDNLLATQLTSFALGWYSIVTGITEALWPLFVLRKTASTWQAACDTGREAGAAAGDVAAQARAFLGLGSAALHSKDYETAIAHFSRAIGLHLQIDHFEGLASDYGGLGLAHLGTGQHGRARLFLHQAVALHIDLGQRRGERVMRRHLAEVDEDMGRYDAALAKLERAAAIDIGPVDPYLLCREHYFFARVFFKKGVLDRAVEHAEQCVHLARECGAENEVANGLMIFADIAAAQKDRPQELPQLESALEIFRRLGAPQADQVRERIAALKRPGAAQ
jgi:tetratricopeptide (TPR) repeat protein